MIIFKEKILRNVDIKELIYFLTLAGLAVLIPAFFHVQWITGSIVNAILVVTLFLLGVKKAILIALVPSLVALSVGLLPSILAIAIPFLVVGNISYILFIDYVYKNLQNKEKGFWFGLFFGAGFKFAFLFLSASFIIKLFTSETVALKIAQIMTWMQFATAVAGGVIAWVILKWLKKYKFF